MVHVRVLNATVHGSCLTLKPCCCMTASTTSFKAAPVPNMFFIPGSHRQSWKMRNSSWPMHSSCSRSLGSSWPPLSSRPPSPCGSRKLLPRRPSRRRMSSASGSRTPPRSTSTCNQSCNRPASRQPSCRCSRVHCRYLRAHGSAWGLPSVSSSSWTPKQQSQT